VQRNSPTVPVNTSAKSDRPNSPPFPLCSLSSRSLTRALHPCELRATAPSAKHRVRATPSTSSCPSHASSVELLRAGEVPEPMPPLRHSVRASSNASSDAISLRRRARTSRTTSVDSKRSWRCARTSRTTSSVHCQLRSREMRPWPPPGFQGDVEAGRKGEAISGGDGEARTKIFFWEVESGSSWRLDVFPRQ
jgi:hypothetical protein